MGVCEASLKETLCPGSYKVPAVIDKDPTKPGAVDKASKASEVVKTFHETPSETKFNFIALNAKVGAEVPVLLGVDPTPVTGGGLLTDMVKVTGTTINNLEPSDAALPEGAVDIKKKLAFTTVPFIIVGIVVEAITNHATMDEKN